MLRKRLRTCLGKRRSHLESFSRLCRTVGRVRRQKVGASDQLSTSTQALESPLHPTGNNTKTKPWAQISSRYRFHIAVPRASHARCIARYAICLDRVIRSSRGSPCPAAVVAAAALTPRLMALTPGDSQQPECRYYHSNPASCSLLLP
jgi:hypothetical protein